MLKAIVFDFDGILADSEPLHFQAFLMVTRGMGFEFDYERYLQDFIGFDDRDAFRVILDVVGHDPGSGDKAARIAALCEQKQSTFETLVRSGGAGALPGAMELAESARHAGLPIAIASGATAADIDLMLGGWDRRDVFEVVVSADNVMRSKPHPESYALAVQRLAAKHADLGLTPGDCLAIEDTPAGLRSARDAGLMTLGVATTGPAEALSDADRVVETLEGVTLAKLREWYESV